MPSEIMKTLDEFIGDMKYAMDFLQELLIDIPTKYFWDDPIKRKKVENCGKIYEKYWTD